MGSARVRLPLVLVLLVVQVWRGDCEENNGARQCQPGFSSDTYVFFVNGKDMEMGRILGNVHFDGCTGRPEAVYLVDDSNIKVLSNGTVTVKHHMKLHHGPRLFTVYTWDSEGKNFSTSVAVLNEGLDYEQHHGDGSHHHHHHHHHVHRTHHRPHHRKHHRPHHNSEFNLTSDAEKEISVLTFPRQRLGQKRQKREWIIPPLYISENERKLPKHLSQVKSSAAKETPVMYSITGEGADQDPKGLFIINKTSGEIIVTQPLDREAKATYTLQLYAVAQQTGSKVEQPMELIVNVIDQNDNHPVFTEQVFQGYVPEGVPPATSVMTVTATDADDPETDNAKLAFSIVGQDPKLPFAEMFTVHKDTGVISTLAAGLDREAIDKYTLILQVADMDGKGLTNTATAIISITDGNDNAPQFDPTTYEGNAPENKVNHEITRLSVTDKDEPHSPAWVAVYSIVKGNDGGFFNITTDSESNQGILKTAKELDFETTNKYILLVSVKNQAAFSLPSLPTSTATVTVNVDDVNEAPVFTPQENIISIPENFTVGQMITSFPAKDPDTAQKQVVIYRIGSDPANWLKIDNETGIIKSRAKLDRESEYVENDRYKAVILAFDNGVPPATGTGTLLLHLIDVNDNAPEPLPRDFKICNENPYAVSLDVVDKDLPPHTSPFKAKLVMNSDKNWTVEMQGDKVVLNMTRKLEPNIYHVNLQLSDNGDKSQLTVVTAEVCQCSGPDVVCGERVVVAGIGLPTILAILGAILALLILVLLLLLFMRRKKKVKEPLLPADDTRDNIYYYDEEGGGEEDQEYDLSQLHRGLDNRPEVTRNDVIPVLMPAPQYRPRPANPDEIGDFIDENLKAADNDPTAPPYDSLLVFDYEGTGSEVGSLSSLNSCSSGDQDYEYLNEWGPRFRKLADMYGGDDD